MLKDHQDAFGHGMLDYLGGKAESEVVERDDGYVYASGGPGAYFSEYEDWPEKDREALKHAFGRVLDIGCGAGRHALYLQRQGMEVVAIDNSPLAIEVCRLRGINDARIMSVTQISSRLGMFDTILMLGNNFGLLENQIRARFLIRRMWALTTPKARIIASTKDPHKTMAVEHVRCREQNVSRGRMPGQERYRVRYKTFATPWFDYLRVSRKEMDRILEGTGWVISECLSSEDSEFYTVIIRKTDEKPSSK